MTELKTRQDFAKLIDELFRDKSEPVIGVEVGVRRGLFSRYLLENSSALAKLYAVDPWEPNCELSHLQEHCDAFYNEAKGNLLHFNERCELIKAYSPKAADLFADNSLLFVYIDALHDYRSVVADMRAFWPKAKSGAIFAGHDYDPVAWPGVFGAVNQFAEENNLVVQTTGIGDNYGESDGARPSWWFIKP